VRSGLSPAPTLAGAQAGEAGVRLLPRPSEDEAKASRVAPDSEELPALRAEFIELLLLDLLDLENVVLPPGTATDAALEILEPESACRKRTCPRGVTAARARGPLQSSV
jgi:hypothetical protein